MTPMGMGPVSMMMAEDQDSGWRRSEEVMATARAKAMPMSVKVSSCPRSLDRGCG
jgi:hypothetical protein